MVWRGHRGGVRALALDVADQRRPGPVAGREEVVEVAAELDPLARGVEAHGGGEPLDHRQPARPQRALQGRGDRPLALVELRVGDGHRRELGQLDEDRLVARGELALGAVDHLEHPELAAAAGQRRAQPRRLRLARAQARGRGGGERAQPRVARHHRHGPPDGRGDRPRGVGRALEDLLDGQGGVDRHRGVGQRAQLLHVRVLDPRDLLHLDVAAMHGLEHRQALAQEVGRRVQARVVAQRGAQRRVVGLGEVEHAQLRGHGLAAEVVSGAERLLAPVGEVGGKGLAVARGERRSAVRPFPGPHGGGKPNPNAASVVRVVQRELRDVPPDVADPADGGHREDDEAEGHEVPVEGQRDDRQREPGRVDERQDARGRRPVVQLVVHWL
jgi:hypothetical protein